MPALTLIGRISAVSLLVGLLGLIHAQPAPVAPQPPVTNIAEAAPASAPFDATSQVSPPDATDEQRGDLLMVNHRYQAALGVYSKIEPLTARLWNKMGIAYQMLFDTKSATRCYKESLKLDAAYSSALNNLATLEDARKNFPAAERLYRQSLKVNPRSARTLKNLGSNLIMQHRYSESSEAYAQALALDPHIMDQFSGPTAEARVSIKDRGEESYLSARTCARAGMNDCAIAQLRKAFDEGFATAKQVASDNDFEAMRGKPAFERLLAEQQ
jgi:tetratricopeptide (TPR) repeat protein